MKNLTKRRSKIHGRGIFTKKKIKKGSIIYNISLKKISKNPKKRLAKIGKNKYVSDKILNHINHSCNPNAKLNIKNKPNLTTLRGILPNEEITVNYNKTELHRKKIKCLCKSKNCKGYFYIS